jgi:hypothetical protein
MSIIDYEMTYKNDIRFKLLTNELTFNIEIDVSRFAQSKGVFSSATVKSSRVSGDRAKDDFLVRAKNFFQTFFAPRNGGRRVAVDNAPQGGVVLLVLQVFQLRLVDSDDRWV